MCVYIVAEKNYFKLSAIETQIENFESFMIFS